MRRVGEEVTQVSAKHLYTGSIPVHASEQISKIKDNMNVESGKSFIERSFERVTRITRDAAIVVAGIAYFLGQYGVASAAAIAAFLDQVMLDATKKRYPSAV